MTRSDKNILIVGTVKHAHAKYKELEAKYTLHHSSTTREELLAQLDAAKASGLVFHAIYRGVGSHYVLGRVDEELLSHFILTPSSSSLSQDPKNQPTKHGLELIASLGAGYDFVDTDFATAHQVIVANTPKVVDNATADATILLLLSTLRHQYEVEYNLRHGLTDRKPRIGRDPNGLTIGIVGMGGIGKAVAKRASSLGMKIVYHNRTPIVFSKKDLDVDDDQDSVIENAKYYNTLDELLLVSDVVSVHVPLSKQTRHLFSDRQFGLMKPGSYFLNTSRGPVVDEEALVRALQREHLAGAGLDVFEFEPKVHPWLLQSLNVALMPHLGAYTIESITGMEQLAMENIDRYLETGKALTPVNDF